MRTLLIALIFGVVFSFGCQEKETGKTTLLAYLTPYENIPEILNGQVKSLTERNHLLVETDGKFIAGAVMSKKDRDSIGGSHDFTIWYTEEGVMKRIENMTNDSLWAIWVMDIEDNLITRATNIRLDTPRIHFEFVYNEKGLFTEALRYRSVVDTLIFRNTYTYDDKDRIIAWSSFNTSGILMAHLTGKYDEKNRLLEQARFNSENIQTSGYRVEYNDMGFRSKVESLGRDGALRSTTAIDYMGYDDHGNWLEAIYHVDGVPKLISKRVYEYY
jgi:hypothetical protein